ncbi:MAG: hypothetical protein F6J93_20085 [Oscillatoria sp. SIO1A7]|nr:hypothetical protein [Oscillatoria sp. SIO1A7]
MVEIVTAIAAVVAAAAAAVQAYIAWHNYRESRPSSPSRGGSQGTRTRLPQLTRTIPWGWLGLLAVYTIRGFLLSFISAPTRFSALASVPLIGSMTILFVSNTKTEQWIVFIIFMIWFLSVILEVFALIEIISSVISDNHSWLISAAIMVFSGLGLGWLAHQIFG